MSLPRDTTPDARAAQLDGFRRMGGRARLEMALQMSEDAKAVTEAGIRHQHPNWTDEQVHEALLVLMLGEDLARQVLAMTLAST